MNVVAGIFWNKNGRVFLAQRPSPPYLWEFPGGKVEDGESFTEALAREIQEELAAAMKNPTQIGSQAHPTRKITVHFFLGQFTTGPVPKEHRALRWCPPNHMDPDTLCPADRLFWSAQKKNIEALIKKNGPVLQLS